ncbi:TAXI family TRAP transporter solute-binding subunit [Enhydrobacter sp.]|jgi:TRAP transporter TAXI family solute receptor|uniref:TAXI family TRAP transporter solute-binding subunit n=1 Tax=Enhydrobacter sp. TaxID=1894999 RepID=UPI002610DCFA|nr:TAXI family TRAP transporter solute-binding subunit [Enhydrobacter sp.]WIM13178.1 MAG: TRAP transporter solute receptor, TAXI family precursor [Enhydrobacter sp.]
MIRILALALVALSATIASAEAEDAKLPATLTFTAYDTGSSGFNIAVAVGKAFKQRHGSDLRVLPAGNDVARLAPVKAGRAQVAANGTGTYFAQEGVFEFGLRDWGPQRLRQLLHSNDCNGAALGVAKDTGVTELKGLRGKRVGMVVGSPALNQNALGMLAFGGLSAADVKLVEFASYGAMWKGVLNNEADAAFASTLSAQPREVDSSPRGLVWMRTPHGDKAGWARLRKVSPFISPHMVTCGSAGLSPQAPAEMAGFPYPIFMAYDRLPTDLAYAITRSMIADYDLYKDGAPGAAGLEVKRQKLDWVVPFHDGAIKALKEAGVWTAEVQKHNDALVARQDRLTKAWAEHLESNPPDDREAFRKAWLARRKQTLQQAGLDVVFE